MTEGQERRNRRTVTEVSGFVKSHPMVLNGKYAAVIFREYVAVRRPYARRHCRDGGGSIPKTL